MARICSPGQRGDALGFAPVLARVRRAVPGTRRLRTRPDAVLADKAYSSRRNRDLLRSRRIRAVIPERADEQANRKAKGSKGGRPPAFDPAEYKHRNVVERCFNKLKEHRAVATRYDKRDYIWRGTIDAASIRIWLAQHAT